MERIVSATEARSRFGELMRRAVESQEPVIIERAGKPYVVILSFEEYHKLRTGRPHEDWQDTLEEVLRLGVQIKARKKGQSLTPAPEEIIRELREERNAQLTDLR